jgi:tellurite resistance protein TerC
MIWVWVGFIALVLSLLALDLAVFHRKAHGDSGKGAWGWSAVWIGLGLAFTVFVYFGYENHWLGLGGGVDAVDGQVNDGRMAAIKYLTGYLVEKSLSVDNVFVIAMMFGFCAIPALYQHRVLFWGILGALVLRGAMIGIGTELVATFHWVLHLFGGFLILTAVKVLTVRSGQVDPGRNFAVRWTRGLLPVTERLHGMHFLVLAGSPQSREPELPGGEPMPAAPWRTPSPAPGCSRPWRWP